MKTWEDFGIDIPTSARGPEVDTTCPKCSASRRKKNARCLSVNLDLGLFVCHHCGWNGTLKQGEGKRYDSPSHTYAKPRIHRLTPLPEKIIAWFQNRGIPERVLADHHIGWGEMYFGELESQSWCVQFPYYRNGELINVKYRTLDKHFRMATGAERILYGVDEIHGNKTLIWVEGEIDRLSVDVAGFSACVSVPDGAPDAKSQQYESKFNFLQSAEDMLVQVETHILAVDNDANGHRLEHELSRRLGVEKCQRVGWPDGCKDANDVLVKHGPEALATCIRGAEPYPVEGLLRVNDIARDAWRVYEEGWKKGCSTGWSKLDEHYTVKPGQVTVVTGVPAHGKALALDTPLPTPTGWTTIGEVQVGDALFSDMGDICRVTRITEVMYEHPCYRLTFADGTTVIADADHQWVTRDYRARLSERNARQNGRHVRIVLQPHGTDQSHLRRYPKGVTTDEISRSLKAPDGARWNHAVAVAKPVNLPEVSLSVDPYILGIWLGDGNTDSAGFTAGLQDFLHFSAEVRRSGYFMSERPWGRPGTAHVTISAVSVSKGHQRGSLKSMLRELGVLGRKHIPPRYLRSSISQREALLQGLMDTDGSVTSYGRCEFTSINPQLATDVHELVVSLGWKPRLICGRAMLNGHDCGIKYRITFTPDRPVFRLARKAQYIRKETNQRLIRRCIVAAEPVPSVPVRCLEVDATSHQFLCTRAFIPTHNTSWVQDLAVNLAKSDDWKFAIFSPEDAPNERLVTALAQRYTKRTIFNDRPNRMSAPEFGKALDWLDEHFHILSPSDEQDESIDTILMLAKTAVLRFGIKGLIIDPWNEIESNRPRELTETEFIGRCLKRIRKFSRSHGVHTWVVAHPTKLYKDKDTKLYPIPTLYDINGSSNWRNKADCGVVIYRPSTDEHDEVEVHLQKIKFLEIGKPGVVTLHYHRSTGRFSE